MTEINPALVLGLAGALSGVLMALLAFSMARAPGWRELRSFALVSVAAAAYCFFNLVHVVPVSPRVLEISDRLAVGSVFVYGLAWIRHLAIADGRPLGRGERTAVGVAMAMFVLALVPDAIVTSPIRTVSVEWFDVTYTMSTVTPLGLVCIVFIQVAVVATAFGSGRRWRDGWHSRMPMIGACLLVATGIFDTLGFLAIIAAPQLIEATTVVVVGGMGVAYARRFIADARRLEELSTKLEQEVAVRTNELLKAQAIAAHHERLAGLGRIAAGVAHEINNPTAVIQQNIDRLRTVLADVSALHPEITMRLDRSRSASQRIAEIVRQLLETGRQPTDNTSATMFELAPVVEKAIVAASATAPELRVTVSVDESLCVSGNPEFLEQVLINLIVNAAHAAGDAPGGGRARIEAGRRGERIRLTVADNGPGIPAAIRDRLFEPFTTTKPVGKGTGLGLAVSRGLMTRQGGSLFVARTTDAGTEMALELPAASLNETGDESLTPTPPPMASNRSRDLRVLVIDDNEELREVLALQLDAYFCVDEAATVDEALAMASIGHPYDAVLCDLMMPAGGAESWLSRCTSVDPRLADRTILLTGGPTTDAASALVAVRREKVVFKPFEIAELRPLIERVSGY